MAQFRQILQLLNQVPIEDLFTERTAKVLRLHINAKEEDRLPIARLENMLGVGEGLACGEADHRSSLKFDNQIRTSKTTADLKNHCTYEFDAENGTSSCSGNTATNSSNADENRNAFVLTESSGSKVCCLLALQIQFVKDVATVPALVFWLHQVFL